MELKNKTICFLGDSITEGVGSTNDGSYVSLFAKAHPEAKVYNLGIGGTRIARQIKPSQNTKWDKYFAGRIDEMPNNTDIICIFGGTNDYGHGDAPFGSLGDKNGYTFSGALYELYELIIKRYPDAKIIVFTPTHRISENTLHAKPDGEYVLLDYVNRIKETAEYFSIPVLDLWSISGIQPEIDVLKERYMPDGLHPSNAGYKKLFDIINAYIKSL